MRLFLALFFLNGGCLNYAGLSDGDGGSDAGEDAGRVGLRLDGGTVVDAGDAGSVDLASSDFAGVDLLGDMAKPVDLSPAPSDMACSPRNCTPGDVQTSTSGCEQRTCGANCTWGGWGLKKGDSCDNGTSMSCIADPTCPHAGIMRCIGCNWVACSCD